MVLVVAHQISARLRYVLQEIFTANHNLTVKICSISEFLEPSWYKSNPEPLSCIFFYIDGNKTSKSTIEFLKNKGEELSHSPKTITIYSEELLWETDINNRWDNPKISWVNTNSSFKVGNECKTSIPVLFPNDSSDIGFDPFAMVFWILSRYEEYLWFNNNERSLKQRKINLNHRFSSSNSHAFHHQYLEIPTVDWVRIFLIQLIGLSSQEEIDLRKQQYQIVPTADIDLYFKFDKRGFLRNLGSWINQLRQPQRLLEHLLSIFTKKDPLDPLNTTLSIVQKSKLSRLFLLHSQKYDSYHKQNDLKNPKVISTIQALFQKLPLNTIGLHPSINGADFSNSDCMWENEKTGLETYSGEKVQRSRFHYLYFHLPNHYQQLIKMNIAEEWSMGYHDRMGFRAATSFSFSWFDLSQNEPSNMQVFPFQIMDVTCKNYLKLNNFTSIDLVNSIKQTIEHLGGNFIFIFHNESVSESYPWKGWSTTIEEWSK